MRGLRFLFLIDFPADDPRRIGEVLDQAMTTAAFDQPVTLLLLDDAVTHLAGPPAVLRYQALALYDVDPVWVERESLEARGLAATDLAVPVRLVSRAEVADLLAASDVVVSG